ncbi:MAG: hypothetical protein IKT10_06380 [Clostridiales bacterium]|nr:hypothetical protein [Clostridiales bacterium]
MKLYTRTDWLFAIAATLIVLLFGSFSLTKGIYPWGDDCAAYISEGIAIAEGKLPEQAQMNLFYHPTDMPQEALESGSLVYVWGYPLLLSVVYKLVGFGVDKVIFYKIPLLLSLALSAGALVLLFRKRLSVHFSFVLAVIFSMSSYLFSALNQLYSDLPFVFFCILTMLLMECICDLEEKGRSVWVIGVFYSLSLWLTYETRLSGSAVCVFSLAEHIIILFPLVKKSVNRRKMIVKHVFPYVLSGLLILVSERLWLMPATANYSDLSVQLDKSVLFQYYLGMIYKYFKIIAGEGNILFLLFLVGMIFTGFQKQNIYFTLLLIGTIIVNCNLPYVQGPRYIYNILPFILLYAANGIVLTADLVKKAYKKAEAKGTKDTASKKLALVIPKICKVLIVVVAALVLINVCSYGAKNAYNNIINWGNTQKEDAYSPYALEVYQYISEKTDADCVICFEKPRMLYLNTGRKSFRYGVNGRNLSDADYYLKFKNGFTGELDVEVPDNEVVLDNEMFVLYFLKK